MLVHPSVCPISPLLALLGAAKQQVKGTNLWQALWALCSWNLDVDCPSGHLTVPFLLCPSVVQNCFPCALSGHTALDQGCRLWVPTPQWLREQFPAPLQSLSFASTVTVAAGELYRGQSPNPCSYSSSAVVSGG